MRVAARRGLPGSRLATSASWKATSAAGSFALARFSHSAVFAVVSSTSTVGGVSVGCSGSPSGPRSSLSPGGGLDMTIPVRNRASMAAKRSQVNWLHQLSPTVPARFRRACRRAPGGSDGLTYNDWLPGMQPLRLGEEPLTLEALVDVARAGRPVAVSSGARQRMQASRAAVEAIAGGGAEAPRVYGVNTGFGALAEVSIGPDQIRELQRNLVRSHAAGVGEPAPRDVVRGVILLRAAVLARGQSGVRVLLCERLCELLARSVQRVIPWQGSVGASGDLAPLAHLALVVIGEGEAEVGGEVHPGAQALAAAGLTPLVLEAKEGLSLVNGTQLMTAAGALAVHDAVELARIADVTGVMSLETIKGSRRPFEERIAAARPHPGAVAAAAALWRLTEGSEIVESHRDCHKVQDAYSFRCMPQVHGATRDGLEFARRVLETEMSAATDNPLVFVEGAEADIVSGGNFH